MIGKKTKTKQGKTSSSKPKVDKKDTLTKSSSPQAVDNPLLIRWRFHLLLFFVFCAFALLVGRVAYIQVVEPDNLIKQGDLRSVRVKSLPSARGII
ncbi:peptidoglycan glycosyltransferase FtsI, partial [Vibrio rotiferianus]